MSFPVPAARCFLKVRSANFPVRKANSFAAAFVLLAFSAHLAVTAQDQTSPVIRLTFVGDILLEAPWQQPPLPPAEFFGGVKKKLSEADLVIGNLEEPLTDFAERTPHKDPKMVIAGKDFIFRATSPDSAAALKDAGIDVAALANNHTMDYQEQGLLDTLEQLRASDIIPVGAGKNLAEADRVQIVELQGIRIGIVALSDVVPKNYWARSKSPGIAPAKYIERVRTVVRRARPHADVLVVVFHWGKMFTPRPNRRQLVWARAAQQSGADLVLGAHPHVLQGIGCFGSAPVVYSAGNFVFPTRNKLARRSAIFEITLSGAKVESVRVVPVLLDSKGRPRLATGAVAESIRWEMELLSTELGSSFTGDTASCPVK